MTTPIASVLDALETAAAAGKLPGIFSALREHDLKSFKACLHRKEDLATTLPDGSTPLHVAVAMTLDWTYCDLLEHGAAPNTPNARGETPLYLASCSNHGYDASRLLEYGADPDTRSATTGETPLMACARLGNILPATNILLANPDPGLKDTQGRTALDLAKEYGNGDVQELLELYISTKRFTDFTHAPITDAARFAPLPELESLLQGGADPNAWNDHGDPPLIYAYLGEDAWERMQLLIRYGADIYYREKDGHCILRHIMDFARLARQKDACSIYCEMLQGYDVNRLDARGCNLLHYACYMGDVDLTKAALQLGADPACRTAKDGLPLEIALARKENCGLVSFTHVVDILRPLSPEARRPLPRCLGQELASAAYAGDTQAMQDLLRAGAPPDGDDWGILSPDGWGDIPLLALTDAAKENPELTDEDFVKMTRMLVKAGADINLSDFECIPPLEHACEKNVPGMVRALLEAGADASDGHALYIARSFYNHECVRILEEWMQARGLDIPAPEDEGY